MTAMNRILITGGAGFIGSHLARELSGRGYQVRILDNFSEQVHGTSKSVPEVLPKQTEVIEGDVRNPKDVKAALADCDAVFHFAASVGVGQSMYEVAAYTDNNNLGTARLLEALIANPVRRLVVASSMSLYGEGLYRSEDGRVHSQVRRTLEQLKARDWEPRDEAGHRLTPIPTPESKAPDLASIYALSKYDQEKMCLLIGKAYGITTTAMRFFNVYGPGQALSNPYTGVMAIFASRLLNDAAPVIFEDGNQVRDFVHVTDVARACRLALESSDVDGETLNIGSGNRYTVREIAERMAKTLGKEHIRPEITQTYRVGDIRHCFADISLARAKIAYEPRMKFEDGLGELADWLRDQTAVDRTAIMREELSAKGLAV